MAIGLMVAAALSAEVRVTQVPYVAPPAGLERFPFQPGVMVLIEDDGQDHEGYLVFLKHKGGVKLMTVDRAAVGTTVALFTGRFEEPVAAVKPVGKAVEAR